VVGGRKNNVVTALHMYLENIIREITITDPYQLRVISLTAAWTGYKMNQSQNVLKN